MTKHELNRHAPLSEFGTLHEMPKESVENTEYIRQTVAFYETDRQGNAIYNICTSIQTKERILKKCWDESNASIRSLSSFDGVESILDSIVYENNPKDRIITAAIPIDSYLDTQELDRLQDQLTGFIKGLQQSFIATPLIDLMPNVEMVERSRARFYLEMSSLYKSGERISRMPINWFDIRTLWEKSSLFLFHPPFIADTMSELLSLVSTHIESTKSRESIKCVVWLDVPPDAVMDNYSEIMDFAWEMRQDGIVLLLGVGSITGQKTFQASVSIMEESK